MNHSEKALKTLTLMNTTPEQWSMPPIRWETREELWNVKKECPTCRGRGQATTYPDGAVFKYSKDRRMQKALGLKKGDYLAYHKQEEYCNQAGVEYRRCPTCPPKRSRPNVGSGVITVQEMTKILVGIVLWAKGTRFDSRFANQDRNRTTSGRDIWCVCQLCSKSITGIYSPLVPVQARGEDGVIHGMWVGEDCARKFLSVEVVLDETQLKGVKKSVLKQRYKIDMTLPERVG